MKKILSLILIIGIGIILFIKFFISPQINLKIKSMPQKVHNFILLHNSSSVILSNISPFIQQATIASQDKSFKYNIGISFRGTIRAVLFSILTKNHQGASTITEQLAKNVYFNDTDNLKTDFLTKIYALYITRMYSKNQILELYLNDIYFGRNAYGINAASKIYFNTDAKNLSLFQSAYLLGLITAPSYLGEHKNAAIKNAKLVLQTMVNNNFITQKQAEIAEAKL